MGYGRELNKITKQHRVKCMKSKISTQLKWLVNTPVTRIVVSFAVCMTFMLLFKEFLRMFDSSEETQPWQYLLRAAANIGIYWIIFRFWEKRSILEISFKKFHLNGIIGLISGFLLISSVVLSLYFSGYYTIVSFTDGNLLLFIFIELFAASVLEEVLLRGIIFRITEENLNTVWALVISSVIYSLLHLSNSGFDVTSFISLMLLGLFLGIIYSFTKNIWSVIFVHLGWNFAQVFYGLKISGRATQGLVNSQLSGHLWLTGGEFGLENSYITIGLLMIAIIFLYKRQKIGYAFSSVR